MDEFLSSWPGVDLEQMTPISREYLLRSQALEEKISKGYFGLLDT